jgi:flagellar biogenesis protein FliO
LSGGRLVLTRSQQLGLVILLFVFIAYVLLRLRA